MPLGLRLERGHEAPLIIKCADGKIIEIRLSKGQGHQYKIMIECDRDIIIHSPQQVKSQGIPYKTKAE